MTSKHPPIVILDFDGVILPSTGANIAITDQLKDTKYRWNRKILSQFEPIDVIRRVERINQESNMKMIYEMYSSFGDILPRPSDRIRFFINLQRNFRKLEYRYANFFPYVIPTLTKLAENAIIGICSNSEGNRINYWLKKYSIQNLITAISSRNDRKYYGVKPNPKILLYTILKIKKKQNLGRIDKNRCYFVGDNISDVKTAKNAAVRSVAVLSGHSTEDELKSCEPDFIIPTLEDIISILDLSEINS